MTSSSIIPSQSYTGENRPIARMLYGIEVWLAWGEARARHPLYSTIDEHQEVRDGLLP